MHLKRIQQQSMRSTQKHSPPTGKSVLISVPRHVASTRTRTRLTCNNKETHFSSHVYAQTQLSAITAGHCDQNNTKRVSCAKNHHPIANEIIPNVANMQHYVQKANT